MEFFVIIVYSFKRLTFFIENSVLDILGVLDPPLLTSDLLMTYTKQFLFSQENLSLCKKSPSLTAQIIYIYIYIYTYIYYIYIHIYIYIYIIIIIIYTYTHFLLVYCSIVRFIILGHNVCSPKLFMT